MCSCLAGYTSSPLGLICCRDLRLLLFEDAGGPPGALPRMSTIGQAPGHLWPPATVAHGDVISTVQVGMIISP